MKKTECNAGWRFGHPGEEKIPVQLPHDAMLHDGRAAGEPTGSAGAFFKAGVYEYEKEIEIPADKEGKPLILQFEGVMRKAKVYVNGTEAGGAAYGYIPFWVDLAPYVKCGEKNLIEVKADNSLQPASRWYTGGGIYRPVWLWEGEETYILPQGLRVKTLSVSEPQIEVEIRAARSDTAEGPGGCAAGSEKEVSGSGEKTAGDAGGDLTAAVEILDAEGNIAAAAEFPVAGMCGKTVLSIPGAKLWSEDSPYLYTCRARLKGAGETADEAETVFGIREIRANSKGLFINGKSTLLRGGSVHHDNGVIGAVSTAESEWRRMRILKEQGFNAIRIAHNPACENLLNAADHYGMYIIDETWDMWYNHKNVHDYASEFKENYRDDIREMAARDYNHPSVIMYSIGNEVSEPAKKKGVELAKELVELFHQLDDSRPVTGGINIMIISQSAKGSGIYKEDGGRDDSAEQKTKGMNSTMFNFVTSMVGTSMNKMGNGKKADAASSPVLDALDVCGYNYGSGRYPLEAKAHPDRVIYGSEIFPQDVAKNWAVIKKHPYLVGDFLWTAWDYIGECGLGAWAYDADGKGFDKPYPWKLGDSGALDILGDANAEMFWSQAAWGIIDRPRITVQPPNHPGVTPAKATWRGSNGIPSWSWRGCEGNKTVVEVFTTGSSAELYLNGRRIGKKKVKECRAVFRVTYAPGTLRAIAYDAGGKAIGEDELISSKDKLHVACGAVHEPVRAGADEGMETVYVEIAVCDAEGTVERNRDIVLTVDVKGGELLGFGSANPRTEDDFVSGTYKTYYGRAQAVVRRPRGSEAVVEIKGENSESGGRKSRISV